MTVQEALEIFGLAINASQQEIKSHYKSLSRKFHPDLGGSDEMMKLINNAYDILKKYSDGVGGSTIDSSMIEKLNAVINKIKKFDITIEIVGSWVWVSGNTYAVKEDLKSAGFKFAPKKKMWFFAPYQTKRVWTKSSMDDIRNKYGSKIIASGKSLQLS